MDKLNYLINREKRITIFAKEHCSYCIKSKILLYDLDIKFHTYYLENEGELIHALVLKSGGQHTVPYVFVNDEFIGGFTDLLRVIVNMLIFTHDIIIFGKSHCPYYVKAKEFMDDNNIEYFDNNIDNKSGEIIIDYLVDINKYPATPQIYIHGKFVGGYIEMKKYFEK